tara:strand:+ start:335 stop:1360 length:1026 start_codon:yes stop_codon:yes gene_type:complete
MYKFFRFFLFLFNPERIHHITFSLIKFGYKIPFKAWGWRRIFTIKDNRLEREVFGIKFPNPVGLAAGFDKDAKLIDELSCFGFGFIEIGTLTPKPQDGNPKPRLFRLKDDGGVINRMGFNNSGVEDAITRLKKRNSDIILGGNIGKNKFTSNESAGKDYFVSFNLLFPYVDYFVVNVSSPNTPGLRDLQEKEPLTNLLNKIQEINNKKEKRKPILLKIAPDLSNEQLDDIIQIVFDTDIDGVIATNTTINRDGLKTDDKKLKDIGSGGLSGKPLRKRSTELIRYLSENSDKAFPIIGVGGIHSPEDAIEKLDAGASLIQIYTGFIYEGPFLVKRINQSLLK